MTKHEDTKDARLATKAVWAGEESTAEGPTTIPVVHSVTFGYRDLDDWFSVAVGDTPGHIYSRNTNPTVAPFEEKVAALEGAEAATSFSTGMAAVSNTLFTLLAPGDRVVSIKDTYGGTNKIFLEFCPRQKIEVDLVTTGDHEAMEAAIAKGCKVVYLETPTNPTLKILDIERLAKAAAKVGAITVVDNTFATPINQNPLALGVDLVLHSATKFLGGHSDAMGGVVCGSRELIQRIFHYREITGATLHPMSAYLLLRGLKTLHLRVERQNASAMEVAKFLYQHDKVEAVYYPGLETHQHYQVARRQMRGFGGMLSFELAGGFEAVKKMLPRLRFAHLAASLGSVGTLVGPPQTTSHVESSPEERRRMGISESLVRYSTGIEDVQDLLEDLDAALKAI
ncbi:MAG: cystathionine gamma-synthase family protein [Deltaproteobacteria bacterium]